MKLSKRGLDLICEFEGYHTALPDGSCKAYLDRLAIPHVWTIGYGCTEGVSPGMTLTKDEAQARFHGELEKHERIVSKLVKVTIGQNNFDALVSFSYNTGGLGKSTLLRKLNRGDFDGAAREFAKWNKAGGKVWKGLVRRRAAEAALFQADAFDNELPEGAPDMPQGIDPPGMSSADKTMVATTSGVGLGSLALADPVGLTSSLVAVKGNGAALFAGVNLGAWLVPIVLAAIVIGVLVWLNRRAE